MAGGTDRTDGVIVDAEGVSGVDLTGPGCAQAALAAPVAAADYGVKRFADLQRVLLEYANAYLRKSASSMAFMAAAWLQHVYETLLRFNLKDEADQIAVRLQDYAKKGAAEMKPISVSIPVDRAPRQPVSLDQLSWLVRFRVVPPTPSTLGETAG